MSTSSNIAAAGYPSHRVSQNTKETPTSRHEYQMQSDIFESERNPNHLKVNPGPHLNKDEIKIQKTENEYEDSKDNTLLSERPAAGFASYQMPSNMKPASASRHHYVMSSDLIGKEMDHSRTHKTTGLGPIEQFPANHFNITTDIDEEQIGNLAEGRENSQGQAFQPGKKHFEGKYNNKNLW